MMSRRILAVDIGSSQLTMGEFRRLKPSGLEMVDFAASPLGMEPGSESDPSGYIVATIREIMRTHGTRPGPVLLSVSGKDIFPRYVKLPPVAREKVGQIVQYEAQQNVPFPIDEVVWDYQLVDNEEGGQSVMLVAIKTEVVKKMTDCVEAAGLDPQIVDVAPMALYNVARFTHGESEGCTLLMDMGARTTNLIFIEKNRIFTRSIPIAGNSMTQDLMKEFDLPFKDAEELKIAHAFVALGGVVEGADSAVVNRIAKTVRSVMTRLHAEVNRSINFYRGQQNGNKPDLLLLTGGSSIIPETDTFLREKLELEVRYLNPFKGIAVASNLSAEDVTRNMHLLGEVVGLALRSAYSCPMEINLIPPNLIARKVFRARIPFFAATVLGLLLTILCWWGVSHQRLVAARHDLAMLDERNRAIERIKSELDVLIKEKDEVAVKANRLLDLVNLRTEWIRMIDGIRSRLPDGMWITSIEPVRSDPVNPTSYTHLKLKGMGFVDKVPDAAAVGDFVHALKQSGTFSDRTEVVNVVKQSAYRLEFTLDLALKKPLQF